MTSIKKTKTPRIYVRNFEDYSESNIIYFKLATIENIAVKHK